VQKSGRDWPKEKQIVCLEQKKKASSDFCPVDWCISNKQISLYLRGRAGTVFWPRPGAVVGLLFPHDVTMLDGTSVVELSVTSEAEQMLRIDMQKHLFKLFLKACAQIQ